MSSLSGVLGRRVVQYVWHRCVKTGKIRMFQLCGWNLKGPCKKVTMVRCRPSVRYSKGDAAQYAWHHYTEMGKRRMFQFCGWVLKRFFREKGPWPGVVLQWGVSEETLYNVRSTAVQRWAKGACFNYAAENVGWEYRVTTDRRPTGGFCTIQAGVCPHAKCQCKWKREDVKDTGLFVVTEAQERG